MPPKPQPDDPSGKRRRRPSDEAGDQDVFSDSGCRSPSPGVAPTHRTRSSTRKKANKRMKAGPKDTVEDEGTQHSSQEDDGDIPDDVQDPVSDAVSRTSSTTFTERRATRLEEKYGDLTTQESLDARAAKWTSQVYKHFGKPVLATKKDGSLTSRFVCLTHPSKHVDRSLSDESTGNLHRHIKICEPKPSAQTQAITEYAQGVNYSYACIRFLLAMWIARRHRPFTIVEDLEFRELLRMLYARVEIPSRVTVSRDLKDIFDDSRARVRAKLQNLPGKVHICIDGWTSPNIISFLGVTAHWHENGRIEHIILDFIKLTKGHSGAYLTQKLLEVLRDFGIIEKVLAVTCDNASNNATMMKELKKADDAFRGPDGRVRCFGHVINLVVKAVLSQFGQKVKSEATGETDKDLSTLDDPDDVDKEEDDMDEARKAADEADIEDGEAPRPELVVTDANIKAGRLALQKIIKLSQKVWNSPTVRAEMASQAKAAGKNSEVLVRAMRTRWNTVTMVLVRALELRPILFNVCDKAEFNKAQGVRLRRFIVEEEEWPILEELYVLLTPFLEVTVAISKSSTPLIHEVISWIDVMTKHLEDTRDNVNKLPMVHAAALKGYKILQKYYRHTDETPFYRVAMLLHPNYKKKYFARARWPTAWVQKSLKLVRTEWNKRYRHAALPNDNAQNANSQPDLPGPSHGVHGTASRVAHKMLAELTGSNELEDEDPLEEYLEAPIRSMQMDPLKFWNNALINGTTDANLAHMALDILSILATSMDAERAFSRGCLTVSRLRHSLSDQTVWASTVLGSWARYGELVPEAEAVALLRQKEKGKDKAVSAPKAAGAPSDLQAKDVITLSDSDSD